jgi:hypothetical protein
MIAHTGWRDFGGDWRFVHAGGAIGADGNDPGVRVELGDPDRRGDDTSRADCYRLPDPPEGEELREAVRRVFAIRRLDVPGRPNARAAAAFTVAVPTRAALGESLASGWIDGWTGAFKTELAANAIQPFFGAGFSRDNPPGSWHSTENALEIQAHKLKDVVFLIDDYKPPPHEVQRMDGKASRLLRNAANRQGRDRATPRGGLQSTKSPRCLLLPTGEALPTDPAALARAVVLHVLPPGGPGRPAGTLDPEALRLCTADAAAGWYAKATAGFVRWLAPRYPEVRAALRRRAAEAAETVKASLVGADVHTRTPEAVGNLWLGWATFAEFAVDCGAVTRDEADDLNRVVWAGLRDLAGDQARHQRDTDPVTVFFELLRAALAQKLAYLADARTGRPPEGLEAACGYEVDRILNGPRDSFIPPSRGTKIGWVHREGESHYFKAFLIPAAAYAAAWEQARRQGQELPLDPKTLSHRLGDRGLLRATEAGNNTVKKTCEGVKHRVWVLGLNRVVEVGDAGTAEADAWDGPIGPVTAEEFAPTAEFEEGVV